MFVFYVCFPAQGGPAEWAPEAAPRNILIWSLVGWSNNRSNNLHFNVLLETNTYIYIYIYVYIYIYIYTPTSLSLYIYIYIGRCVFIYT